MRVASGLLCAALAGVSFGVAASALDNAAARLRRPIVLVLSDQWLYVANREGGISIVDARRGALVGEAAAQEKLADLTRAGSRQLLAVDQSSSLLRLSCQGAAVEVAERLSVGMSPVSVRVLNDK